MSPNRYVPRNRDNQLGLTSRRVGALEREKNAAAAAATTTSAYAGTAANLGSLVAYWRMGALSGNQPDTSGNVNGAKDLVLQAGTTASTYHVTGPSLLVASDDGAWQSNLNQTTDYPALSSGDYFAVDDPSNPSGIARWSFSGAAGSSSPSDFTVSFWIYLRSGWSIPLASIPIIGTDPGGASPSGWVVTVNATGYIQFITGAVSLYTLALSQPISTNVWTHVACTATLADNTKRIYINGSLAVQQTGVAVAARTNIRVGGGDYNGSGRGSVYAALDEVALYSRPLTPGEIGSLAAATDPTVLQTVPVTAAYTVSVNDDLILANGTFTVTLYTAVGNRGRTVTVKNTGAGTITVGRTGTEQIDAAAANITLATTKQSRQFTSDGAGWQMTAAYL